MSFLTLRNDPACPLNKYVHKSLEVTVYTSASLLRSLKNIFYLLLKLMNNLPMAIERMIMGKVQFLQHETNINKCKMYKQV